MPDNLDAGARLAAIADDYWQGYLAFNPVAATSIGFRDHDDRMDDPSPEAGEAHRTRLAEWRRQAEDLPIGELAPGDAATRDALLAQVAADDAALSTGVETWSVDPLEGPPVLALDLESFQPIADVGQADAMVARWQAIGPWLDQHGANLRRGLADGRVAVRTPVRKALAGVRATLARPDEELPLLAPAQQERPDWPAEDTARFRDALAAAVRDGIRPALERYATVLEEEVLPVARPDEEPGIAHVPGGEDAYRALIRLHTSLDLSPADIHAVGLAEVERIDEELERLGGRVLGRHGRTAILEALRSDPSLYFETRDEVFEKAETSLARAREAIPAWFGILPRAECIVTRIGPHEEEHGTIAYYRQPAVDGSRPGEYYINTSAPRTRPRYEAEVLAYHESIPGHHLQIAIAQELPDLPEFRRHLGPTAFVEGWGLYTERLSDEMGLYSGDLDRIGVLSFDAWRACRLVVDTGMHALGWTRAQAIAFMTEHTALAPNNIENEVDRYIVWPGQALAYKIGQLEILRLRDEARARQADRWEIRAFHDAVLGHGALGLQALRTVVERELI